MRDGHRNECKTCFRRIARARYAADPEKAKAGVKRWQQENAARLNAYRREHNAKPEVKRRLRDGYYRRTYGISADEVDEMLASQGGGCAICGDRPKRAASMHLDHEHAGGKVRAILCLSCNQGIGKFRDDPAILRAAAEYLQRMSQP
jgi:hypothetical protein